MLKKCEMIHAYVITLFCKEIKVMMKLQKCRKLSKTRQNTDGELYPISDLKWQTEVRLVRLYGAKNCHFYKYIVHVYVNILSVLSFEFIS